MCFGYVKNSEGEIRMANILKKEPGDIGKDELIAFLKNAMAGGDKNIRNKKNGYGWGDSNFIKKLKEFCVAHDLPDDAFFLDPDKDKRNVIIRSDWKDYALALMLTYNENPYLLSEYDLADKASVEKIVDYHKTIIDLVENYFSDDSKYAIMNTSLYQSMLAESISMDLAMEKMNELAIAMGKVSMDVRSRMWLEIYIGADYLIYRIYEIIYQLEEEKNKEKERRGEEFQNLMCRLFRDELQKETNGKEDVESKWEGVVTKLGGSMDYLDYLGAKRAQEDDDALNDCCNNISQLLAAKLRESLQDSMEADNLQIDDNGNFYDVFKGVTDEIRKTKALLKAFDKKYSYKELTAKHIEEHKKVAERIKEIKRAPQEFETMEEIIRKKVVNMKAGIDQDPQSYSIKFYELFLEFAQLFKDEANQKEKSTNVFDAAILKTAYQYLKPER